MKVLIDYERPPLRAVYRFEFDTDGGPIESAHAAAQAAAALQFQEEMRVKILSVALRRSIHTPRPIACEPAPPAFDSTLCEHEFESNPGMYDTSHRYCVKCGVAE